MFRFLPNVLGSIDPLRSQEQIRKILDLFYADITSWFPRERLDSGIGFPVVNLNFIQVEYKMTSRRLHVDYHLIERAKAVPNLSKQEN